MIKFPRSCIVGGYGLEGTFDTQVQVEACEERGRIPVSKGALSWWDSCQRVTSCSKVVVGVVLVGVVLVGVVLVGAVLVGVVLVGVVLVGAVLVGVVLVGVVLVGAVLVGVVLVLPASMW